MSDTAAFQPPPIPPGEGQLIVPGSPPAKKKKKIINLLNRTPSPVILEDYGALEPGRCTVGGPGIAGGIVGIATSITVTARDAAGVHIREGGEKFILTLKHPSKGSVPKTYDTVDHGDGHYTFTGVRADLKGMHQLSVEVNGSLVGDSPYLVMFEVDDGAEMQPEDEDGNGFVTGKTAAASVKEKIVFVQHMNPSITADEVHDQFGRFGKLVKCERLDPARDVWMLQYSKPEDAAEAATMNATVLRDCTIEVAVASHMGGVGTHPMILNQLQQIQTLQLQEQQSLTWATQLAQQRASVRQAGGQVEELTDTRKKRKAVALMQRLQAKVAQAQQTKHLGEGAPGAFGGARTFAETEQQDDLRKQRGAARERVCERSERAADTRASADNERAGEGGDKEQSVGGHKASDGHRGKGNDDDRKRDREEENRSRRRRDEDTYERRKRRDDDDRHDRERDRGYRSERGSDRDRDRYRSYADDDRRERSHGRERGRDRDRERDRGERDRYRSYADDDRRDRPYGRDRGRERGSRDRDR